MIPANRSSWERITRQSSLMSSFTVYNGRNTKEAGTDSLVDKLLGGWNHGYRQRDPTSKKKPCLKRVAAYCHGSTKAQDQLDSLATQEQYYEERIKANPRWQFTGIYSDVGSGTTVKKRKWLNVLISACKQGQYGFDQIYLSICQKYISAFP